MYCGHPGERGETLALDVGCAVGAATFALARGFSRAVGVDYSQAFVDAAKVQKMVSVLNLLH